MSEPEPVEVISNPKKIKRKGKRRKRKRKTRGKLHPKRSSNSHSCEDFRRRTKRIGRTSRKYHV